MAAGQIIIPGAMPTRDRNGRATIGKLFFYEDGTQTPAPVYTSLSLTTALPNPVVSDAAGRFPAIWADDAERFTVVWTYFDEEIIKTFSGIEPGSSNEFSGPVQIGFVAEENDVDALRLTVDADGFGDVKALNVAYSTGAIQAGEAEAPILVNVNNLDSTGGTVIGLGVLATDGPSSVYAVKAGAEVGPILQGSGTFANPTTGTNDTASTNVPAMIDGSTGTSTTIFVADNDYIIIGAATPFTQIEFILDDVASDPGVQPTFGYSIAGAGTFTAFSPIDGTNGFRNSGVVAWEAADLVAHGINSDTGTYDIKITRTRNSAVTVSLYYAKVAATLVYKWDESGNLTINTIEVGNASDTTLARSSAGNLSIEGNVIYRAGGVDVPVTDGGTGASDASGARTNLGLVIGTDVQAYNARLQDISTNLTATSGTVEKTGADTFGTYTVTTAGKALLDDVDASAQRTTLGLGTAAVANIGDATGNVVNADISTLTAATDVQDADLLASYRSTGPLKKLTATIFGSYVVKTLTAFLQAGTGATARTAQAKMRDVVSIKDFGAVGDGSTDDTAAFDLALAYVESLQRGGEIYFPPGRYVGDFDLSKTAPDFDKHVTLRGAGRGATQLWPTGTGAIILNMVGRNIAHVCDLSIVAGDTYSAQIGILLARSVGSTNANNNKFVNVEVIGNFSTTPVMSLAAESTLWDNCYFTNSNSSNDHNCFTTGSTPGLSATTVTGAGQTLIASVNTDIRMINCEFYAPYSGAKPFIVSRSASYAMFGCAWICPTSFACVTFTDADGGVISGNLQCFGNHYEGGGHVFYVDATGVFYLRGLCDVASINVMDAGSTYLDYDRESASNTFVLEQSRLAPGRHINSGFTGMGFYADITTNCVIDYTQMADQGSVYIFAAAQTSFVRAKTSFIRSASGSDITYYATAIPTAGVFPEGAAVINERQSGSEPAAWVAVANTLVDPDPGGMAIAITSGSNVATLGASYSVVYEGGSYYIGTYGTTVVRKKSGTTVYLAANMSSTNAADSLNTTGAVFGTFINRGHLTQKDTTANRPTLTAKDIGVLFLDTTLDADGKAIWWTGTAWVDATGAVV